MKQLNFNTCPECSQDPNLNFEDLVPMESHAHGGLFCVKCGRICTPPKGFNLPCLPEKDLKQD